MSWLKPESWSEVLTLIGARYFLLAALFWLVCYVLLRRQLAPRKIQARFPKGADYRREIGYSALTILIFSLFPTVLLLTPAVRQHTLYYAGLHDYPTLWFWLAFPATFLVHDAYFYWTHRLMHHRRLFRIFHLVHHQSTNPSPWAAFSFHPLEAMVEAGIFPVLLFCMPLHAVHIGVFFAGQMLYNVYGHLGWELYPARFLKGSLGRWLNSSTAHNAHHQFFKGNYGLYFLWWDRWCGTLRDGRSKSEVSSYKSVAVRSRAKAGKHSNVMPGKKEGVAV